MAVVRQKERTPTARGLSDMLGKTVAVDGCFIGYVGDICIEQNGGAVAMQLLVMMTPDTLDNVREYEYIQNVMGGEADNEESENHL